MPSFLGNVTMASGGTRGSSSASAAPLAGGGAGGAGAAAPPLGDSTMGSAHGGALLNTSVMKRKNRLRSHGAAPAARSSWAMAVWPLAVALERAVAPLLAAKPGCALQASSCRTTSKWPSALAMISGV